MKGNFPFLVAIVSLTASLATPTQVTAQKNTPAYTITDLGVVGGPPGQPFHITNNGLISGSVAVTKGGELTEEAVLYFRGFMLFIGKPGLDGRNSVTYSVNQWGEAVGEADTAIKDPEGEDYCGFAFMGYDSGNFCRPFVWQAGVMTTLPLLQDKLGKRGNNGTANAINRWGEVAGVSETMTTDTTCPAQDPSIGQAQIFEQKPVVWRRGDVHELPTVGDDPDGTALAINDKGAAAGTSGTCTAFNINSFISVLPVHAILWENGRAIDLGHLPGGTSGGIALAMNNRDDVVGGSNVADNTTSHAFLWTKESGKMQDLPPVGDDFFSTALGVNDSREVTGVSIGATTTRATLWREGVPADLNMLISGNPTLYLITACSINERGQIIGLAIDPNTNEAHGYLATPTWSRGDALSKPLEIPEWVRAHALKQVRFGHFASPQGNP